MDQGSNMSRSLKGPRSYGALKSPLNGHTFRSRHRVASHGSGFVTWNLNIVARLLTWYSIITILFRCPSTLKGCDETVPYICKPYVQLKQIVIPHVEPYYQRYAAPYVELARPYYKKIDKSAVTPVWTYANTHGAPHVRLAQALGKAQWAETIQPQLTEYRKLARTLYNQTLAPHVGRASKSAMPYIEFARANALRTFQNVIVPVYKISRPLVFRAWAAAFTFTTEMAIPSAAWASERTREFLDSIVWPYMRVIYVENVEPQLVRIGRRLGRHNGKKTIQNAAGKISSIFVEPTVSTSSTAFSQRILAPSATKTGGEKCTMNEASRQIIVAPESDESEEENGVRRVAREIVAKDLQEWQARYAKAADEGASEIEDRVDEIAKRMIRRNARTIGKSLLRQLEGAVAEEMTTLRQDIIDIVEAVKIGSSAADDAQEEFQKAVRRAGLAIKEKAHHVRMWRDNYDKEMQIAITKAADNSFAILNQIQDLALQKIGMKWAWMEGITYKDWAKYHELKGRFEEWQGDLEKLIITNPRLEAAQAEGADIEESAMQTATTAAKELARLKMVAQWKLVALDTTDEFDSDLIERAAGKAERVEAEMVVYQGIGEGYPKTSLAPPAASAVTDQEMLVVCDERLAASQDDQSIVSAASWDDDNLATSIEDAQLKEHDYAAGADSTRNQPSPESSAIISEMPKIVANATKEASSKQESGDSFCATVSLERGETKN